MPDLAGGEAALARIHARFAKRVRYSPADQDEDAEGLSITAVRENKPAGVFMDHQQNVRQLGFEIRKAELPAKPDVGDTLVEDDGEGESWEVIEVTDRDDVDAWFVLVDSAEVNE